MGTTAWLSEMLKTSVKSSVSCSAQSLRRHARRRPRLPQARCRLWPMQAHRHSWPTQAHRRPRLTQARRSRGCLAHRHLLQRSWIWRYPWSSLHLSSPQSLPRLRWSRPAFLRLLSLLCLRCSCPALHLLSSPNWPAPLLTSALQSPLLASAFQSPFLASALQSPLLAKALRCLLQSAI